MVLIYWIVFKWRHVGQWQRIGGHEFVQKESCGDWPLFSSTNLLLFQQICIVCWPREWKAFIRSFHMTSRRPYSCTKKWNSAMFVRLAKKSWRGGGGGIEFLFHVKTCICSKTFAQLLATWIVRKWVPRRSFYLRHSLRLDIHRLVVLLFLLKTGLEAKYALTKYCLIYEQECSIRFKTQGLGLIKRELVVNQLA